MLSQLISCHSITGEQTVPPKMSDYTSPCARWVRGVWPVSEDMPPLTMACPTETVTAVTVQASRHESCLHAYDIIPTWPSVSQLCPPSDSFTSSESGENEYLSPTVESLQWEGISERALLSAYSRPGTQIFWETTTALSDSNHNGPSFIVFLWVRLRVLTTNLYALTTGKSSFMAGVVLFNSANSIVTCDTTAFPPGVFCTVETVINKCPRFPPSEEVLLPQHHSWTSWTDLKTSQQPVRGPSGLAQAGSSSQTGHNL